MKTPLEIIAELEAGAERATAGPCPFCGSATKVHTHPDGHTTSICCSADDCVANTASTYSARHHAIAAWNKRTSVPMLCKALRAAVETLGKVSKSTEITDVGQTATGLSIITGRTADATKAASALTAIAEIMKETK